MSNLKELRESFDKTQKDIAQATGWDLSKVQAVENATDEELYMDDLRAFVEACGAKLSAGMVFGEMVIPLPEFSSPPDPPALCNQCGETCAPPGSPDEEYGLIRAKVSGGYFSHGLSDGSTYHFSLCETCLKKMFDGFKIPTRIVSWV